MISSTLVKTLTNISKHLRTVFDRLRITDLKLKIKKCSFFRCEQCYLGNLISEKGIHLLPEKLQSTEDFPMPKTSKEAKQMLGLTGYYDKSIPAYAHLIRTLAELMQKRTISFIWIHQCQKVFNLLKEVFMKSQF